MPSQPISRHGNQSKLSPGEVTARKKQSNKDKATARAIVPISRSHHLKKPSTRKSAPKESGLGSFNPWNMNPIPTLLYQGEALPIPGKVVRQVNTDRTTIYCILSTGVSSDAIFSITVAGVKTVNQYPTWGLAALTGGPTSMRAMKSGIKIENVSKRVDMGGRVYVLNTNQRFELPAAPSTMTSAQAYDLNDIIVAHPKTNSYSGADFLVGKTFYSTPHESADFLNFRENQGSTLTMDQFMSSGSVYPSGTVAPMPMSAIWVVIAGTTTPNDYQLTARAMNYARYPADQLMSSLVTPTRTMSAEMLNKMRKHAEVEGSKGVSTAPPRDLRPLLI
jgi:hypothetical protein